MSQDNEIYSIFEIVEENTEVRYIAGFEALEDAFEYVQFLSSINRKAWVYGYQEPPYKWLREDLIEI